MTVPAAEKGDTRIAAGQFKATCLKVLDEVAETRAPVTITKRGRPVARLVPIEPPAPLFGALSGTVGRYEDLISPIGDSWDAIQ
ncbi:type II toxin-antitoxin system Phd/YefM family antitoxin [Phytoactinopolyspora halotolerans]|uniref:Antitoxin n=1 Tax=Phytoactinopolyspora halotolerans TaxID=1981512 RepID=A0A6L9S7J5_9ACTN|nr:type II toxin-antitoxin system Phd/YefM family antitoxin [Phytoactinopolyspora halotolerans]NED99939.1 type II toxin-antitoxin system Phd/YefM family antitoxin [Phytoactinopolyspora halotolerans]